MLGRPLISESCKLPRVGEAETGGLPKAVLLGDDSLMGEVGSEGKELGLGTLGMERTELCECCDSIGPCCLPL